MLNYSKNEVVKARELVRAHVPETPQYLWPLLNERAGCQVWVKHENHTPTGAFKARGGVVFLDWLRREHPEISGVITATRGNHGQAQARAASVLGLGATILVPHGNSVEKNAAMRAFGAEVIEFGDDFDEAKQEASRLAEEKGLFMAPPFHREIVLGVSTYAFEFFEKNQELDTVYVPIGCGSGVCGMITARDMLGLKTKIVGVVSANALAVKLSFEQGKIVGTDSARTFADGVAVRGVIPEAFEVYSRGMERVVAVSEDEIAEAIRVYYQCTHNAAEGAGAAPLAALLQEREQVSGKTVGVVLSGGNIDMDVMAQILRGETPEA